MCFHCGATPLVLLIEIQSLCYFSRQNKSDKRIEVHLFDSRIASFETEAQVLLINFFDSFLSMLPVL